MSSIERLVKTKAFARSFAIFAGSSAVGNRLRLKEQMEAARRSPTLLDEAENQDS